MICARVTDLLRGFRATHGDHAGPTAVQLFAWADVARDSTDGLTAEHEPIDAMALSHALRDLGRALLRQDRFDA